MMFGLGVHQSSVPAIVGALRICGVGDSNTFGSGVTHLGAYEYWLRDYVKSRNMWWVGSQRRDTTADGFFPCEGYPGWTCNNGGSGQILNLIDSIAANSKPDIWIFQCGVNDTSATFGNTGAAGVATAHLACLSKILADQPTATIVVCTIPPVDIASTHWNCAFGVNIPPVNASIAANVSALRAGGADVHLCDLYAACIAQPDFIDTCLELATGIHLNDLGQQIWANALIPVLDTL